MNMNATAAWLRLLKEVLREGREVAPRGKPTVELPQRTTIVDMMRPVILSPSRKLNYRFMAAEAYWILAGDDSVAGIAPYNSRIADFSDDGERFFGAYGPKIVDQLPYVLDKLREDPDTRQAGLTIWREKPPTTKDVPCTVAIFFSLRRGFLHEHVFMRSSDCWLGVPYDVFNFSMLAHLVCARLNTSGLKVVPGKLYLTAASAHLYEPNWADAKLCLGDPSPAEILTPELLYQDEVALLELLKQLRDTSPGSKLRWWEA